MLKHRGAEMDHTLLIILVVVLLVLGLGGVGFGRRRWF
jgi:hypothetical protein